MELLLTNVLINLLYFPLSYPPSYPPSLHLSSLRVLTAGRECAVAFKALLELIHQVVLKPTYDKKQKLPAFSKEVATCVGEVVQAAEVLKGGYLIPGCVSCLNQMYELRPHEFVC